MPSTSPPLTREVTTTVALTGFCCLVYELLQVRMLGFFLGNSMDFLAIPLALLGLAIGSLFYNFFFKGDTFRLLAGLRLAALPVLTLTFVAFFLVANLLFNEIHIGLADPRIDAFRLVVYSLTFLPPYVVFGTILSAAFHVHAGSVGRLYFHDLLGASLGCVVLPLLLHFADLWVAIISLLVGGLGLWMVQAGRRKRWILAALASFAALLGLASSGRILREHPDPRALARFMLIGEEKTPVRSLGVRWNEIARTDLIRIGEGRERSRYAIVQDNGLSNVQLSRWKPEGSREQAMTDDLVRSLPWSLGREPEKILVMFAGAGKDMMILDQLAQGRATITGVELNPLVLSMSHHPQVAHLGFRDFHALPQIRLLAREGRDFLNQDHETYDLIHVANNGAVFSSRTGHTRKFLDTFEAMRAYLDHLAPDGLLLFQNQPVAEKIPSILRILEERGLPDPRGSLFVFGSPYSPDLDTMLVKPGGFTVEETALLQGRVSSIHKAVLLYAPGGTGGASRIAEVVAEPSASRLVTDDRPFVRGLELGSLRWLPSQESLKDRTFVSSWIKAFSVIFFSGIAVLIFLFARLRGGLESRVPAPWALFLLCSGVGYMAVEVGLISKTELLVGNPLHAVAINLAVFLLANSVGALLQDRHRIMRGPLALCLASALSILWGVLVVELASHVLLSLWLPLKVLVVVIATFPPGLVLGTFYTVCVQSLVRDGREGCVPMTYAMTTLSSVLGSVLAMTAVLDLGFNLVIALGATLYLISGAIAARRLGTLTAPA